MRKKFIIIIVGFMLMVIGNELGNNYSYGENKDKVTRIGNISGMYNSTEISLDASYFFWRNYDNKYIDFGIGYLGNIFAERQWKPGPYTRDLFQDDMNHSLLVLSRYDTRNDEEITFGFGPSFSFLTYKDNRRWGANDEGTHTLSQDSFGFLAFVEFYSHMSKDRSYFNTFECFGKVLIPLSSSASNNWTKSKGIDPKSVDKVNLPSVSTFYATFGLNSTIFTPVEDFLSVVVGGNINYENRNAGFSDIADSYLTDKILRLNLDSVLRFTFDFADIDIGYLYVSYLPINATKYNEKDVHTFIVKLNFDL